MRFDPHPLSDQVIELKGAFYALAGKFSFLIMKHYKGGWVTSWQDQEKGGSASSTEEGPFTSLQQAEANCRRIYKALKQKN